MSQRKDRKEQIPPPQIPKWKGDVQTKPQRPAQQHSPDSAARGHELRSGLYSLSVKQQQPMSESNESKDGQLSANKTDQQQQRSQGPIGQSALQHQAQLDSVFMVLEENIISFVKNELKKFQRALSSDHPECLDSQKEAEDKEQWKSREAFLKITLHFLRGMKKEELADCLQSRSVAAGCQNKLKSKLKEKFQCVFEGIAKSGNPTSLNQIYTELYVTEGGTGGINHEHEVRQIEIVSKKQDRPETTIKQGDILKPLPDRDEPIRTVMTKGVAGIGKTVLTQIFTLDWAEGKANQDIQFIFPFTFRELNLVQGKKFSLVELVHHFFPETKDAGICRFEEFQVVFIFDGLDECRLPLDFDKNKILTNVTESSSVDVLLTNLIKRNLLPSARLWITTRPAAANQIPPECVDMVTEVKGFTDPQKEEYFRKRFRDQKQANKIISHIETSRSLHIMCHIPVFCWITATVLEEVLRTREEGDLPKTLTEMYIHFLVVQSKLGSIKYESRAETDTHWSPESKKVIKSLGKLAFEQLQKGNLIFYESDLLECGIDIRAASVYSGVFTQIFKEEKGLYQDKVFCFVHLSVQEFLAALHVHMKFINTEVNVLSDKQTESLTNFNFTYETVYSVTAEPALENLHKCAVDMALQSPNGHLDLFLRFLLGLSLQTNQTLLKGLLKQTGSSSQTNQGTIKHIKNKISRNMSAEKSINLFHCLNELNDQSLVEEIKLSLRLGCLRPDTLSPAQWSALVFILLSSEKDLDVFDLKQYYTSEKALLRLLPVVKASNKALLKDCDLSQRSCKALALVLSSQVSNLRELDLCNNNLQDSGMKLLCTGLMNSQCKLESIRLTGCNLSERGYAALSSVLSSQSSSLRMLDLSKSNLQDSGVKLLSEGLQSQHCTLETIRFTGCNLSGKSCAALSSVLSTQNSSLRELDLSKNKLRDSGVKLLCAALKSPHCKLKTIRFTGCNLSVDCCLDLSSVLSSQSSSLRELDLSNNKLQDFGVVLLSKGLLSPDCTLETLRLTTCNLSEKGCEGLSPVLRSQFFSLKELDLSNNNLQDSGVTFLSKGLQSPTCKLKSLSLSGCLITEEGCTSLAEALSANPSHLRELDLSYNHPGDSGKKLLSAGLNGPVWKLDKLRVDHDGEQRLKPDIRRYFTELTLDSNTAHRDLRLSENTKKAAHVEQDQLYPDRPDRFEHRCQLLCKEGLTGRCYWEVKWAGGVNVSVSYKGINRKGGCSDCVFGFNDQSWSLICTDEGYSVWHNNKEKVLNLPSSSVSHRVAVYVDCPAGSLSFYSVSSDTLIHLHTYNTTFTEPLYPGFGFLFRYYDSSVTLCSL